MSKKTRYAFLLVFFLSIFTTFQTADADSIDINNDEFVEVAKKYLGVPYVWGGTTPDGFDSSGFTGYVFNEIGVKLPRTTKEMYKEGVAVAREDLRVGDIMFFETISKGASHTGIYIGNEQFIHNDSDRGVIISSINDPYYWLPKYYDARRVVELNLPDGEYYDVPNDYWAVNEITEMSKLNYFVGYEGSYFKPNNPVTRAQVATLLVKALNLNNSFEEQVFNDVPEEYWASGAINTLYREGYVNGYETNDFRPKDPLTRDQLAALFSRAFELKETTKTADFNDVQPSNWAYQDINRLAAAGITTGDENKNFRPRERVSRAQFAVFLYRTLR